MKPSGQNLHRNKPRMLGLPSSLAISLLYLILGTVWITLSDNVAAALTTSDEQLISLSRIKVWIFVTVTAMLLYAVLRKDAAKQTAIRDELVESHRLFRMLFDSIPAGVAIYQPVENNSNFIFVNMNPAGLAYSKTARQEIIGKKVTECFPGIEKAGILEVFKRVAETGQTETVPLVQYKDARIEQWVENNVFKLPSGMIVAIFNDITEQRKLEKELQQFSWLLDKEEGIDPVRISSDYGDVTALNKDGLILKSVGKPMLQQMTSGIMALLDTCLAVYERNGDYALGTFVSTWCGTLDNASRKRCNTDDNREALQCGKWLCHESCWAISKEAIDAGEPVDRPCAGGIRIYAVPIRAGDEIIGAVNFGYGTPPDDAARQNALASDYGIPPETIRRNRQAYRPRPPFIIEVAKQHLQSVARLIGETVARQQKENELSESRAVLQAALDQSQAGIAIADAPDGRLRYVNRAGLMIRGKEAEEIVLDTGIEDYVEKWQILHAEDGTPYKDDEVPLTRAVRYGETNSSEFVIRRADEEDRLVWANAAPIKNDQNEVVAGIVVFLDVTDLRKTEEELRTSRQLLSIVLDAVPDLLWLKNVDGKYLLCNKRFEQFLGRKEKDIIHRTDHELMPKETADQFREKDRLAMEKGGPSVNEEEITYASDHHRELLETIKTPVHMQTGELLGILGIGRNISERKKSEELLRRHNAELEQFNKLATGRELRMIELKQEINALCRELGRKEPYGK